ncbi:MAG TPA: helix-hairpin-helix domain-containing protein [Gemmatimonadales bacterium]|nr:helix-hairpin-helix domain-containing protein [Gemmatimonadales bacterium]
MTHDPQNVAVAARLEELAALLEHQGASPFRVEAYRRAAETVYGLDRPVAELLALDGVVGLERLPTIGTSIARAIRDLVATGRLPMLDRLRGESDAVTLLASVPGIGPKLAERLHEDHGIDTLEELEAAAHDGRLAAIPLFGEKRLLGIRDALAARLGRVPRSPPTKEAPAVADLLAVDREYRRRAAEGSLRLIAPRRFNPRREAWLPVLHTLHRERAYTALFSNTARAHELGKTHEWVVMYVDGGGEGGERQYTVVTATRGPLAGKRVVRGREVECAAFYRTGKQQRGDISLAPLPGDAAIYSRS